MEGLELQSTDGKEQHRAFCFILNIIPLPFPPTTLHSNVLTGGQTLELMNALMQT